MDVDEVRTRLMPTPPRMIADRDDPEAKVGLIALLGRDQEQAAAFVESELGPIQALGKRSQRVLRTLETFLEHGQRVANASAICGLHRDTVYRHLCEIEELIGCKIEERSADLLLALRLRRAFGGSVLRTQTAGSGLDAE
jgi:DNA-binding PucR family transcriptional regulator